MAAWHVSFGFDVPAVHIHNILGPSSDVKSPQHTSHLVLLRVLGRGPIFKRPQCSLLHVLGLALRACYASTWYQQRLCPSYEGIASAQLLCLTIESAGCALLKGYLNCLDWR
jgi:hypothetical protein